MTHEHVPLRCPLWRAGVPARRSIRMTCCPRRSATCRQEALANLEADDGMEITQGGGATTAWARFQFEETTTLERDKVADALRRYCELGTLAMVMIYEA